MSVIIKFWEIRTNSLKYDIIAYDRDKDKAIKLFTKRFNEQWGGDNSLAMRELGKKLLTFDDIQGYWGACLCERKLGETYCE